EIRAKRPIDGPHAEIVMPGAVAHPERLDEGRKDERSVELERLEMVPSKDFLLDKGAEEGHAFHETFATIEEPADERFGIERWNRNCILLIEEEHSVSVDLRDEELVGGGRFQHREIDEEEFGRPLQAAESLGNPRRRGPRDLMPDVDGTAGGQRLLDDLERRRAQAAVDYRMEGGTA